ncbi:hypothetical protein Mycsm_06925 (plasmid) [Mycobacterium sp. JS623]|nr:hypothetical protein Mycsm_06925 [Mycobacterium sp. JS623]
MSVPAGKAGSGDPAGARLVGAIRRGGGLMERRLRGNLIGARRPWRAGAASAVAVGLSATLMAWHVRHGGPLTAMALPISVIALCTTAAIRCRRATELAMGAGHRRRCAPQCNEPMGSPAMADSCPHLGAACPSREQDGLR